MVAFHVNLGYKSTDPSAAIQQPFINQVRDTLPRGHPAHAELGRQFAFGRQFLPRLEITPLDLLVQGTNILNRTNFSAVNDSFPGGCMLPQSLPQPLPPGGICNPQPFQVGPYLVDYLNGPFNFRGVTGLDPSSPLGFKAAFDPRQVQFGLKLIF